MTEAQEKFVRRLTACREGVIDASEQLDAIEVHGPGGEHAIGAALSVIDAAVQIKRDNRARPT